jgi:uncharacterized coiled-coil protein SlyX
MKFSLWRNRGIPEDLLIKKFDELQDKIIKELTEVVAYYKAFITRMPCEANQKLLNQLNERVKALEYQELNERVTNLEKLCNLEQSAKTSRTGKSRTQTRQSVQE